MMASRGMGAIRASKMPKKEVIHRKDKPQDVDMYAAGGMTVRNARAPGAIENADTVDKPKGPGNPAGRYSTLLDSDLQKAKAKAQSMGLSKEVQAIGEEEALRGRLKGMKRGGNVWSEPRPQKLGKSKELTEYQKHTAQSRARRKGRAYPNLIDNMWATKE
jgi:hypothetical protein